MGDDIEHLRRRLALRSEECFDRLEDAVSELCAVHSVPAEAILARVQATIDKECSMRTTFEDASEAKNMRFLIVDDRSESRAAVRLVLERRGHTVIAEAATREEALAATDRFEPDAVLVDLRLGDESGLDLARALTATRPQLAVLMVSVDSSATPELVRAHGARGFVVKTRLDQVDFAALLRNEDVS